MTDQVSKWNTAFGMPVDGTSALYIQVSLTFCVGSIAVILSQRALKLSNIPMSLLWILYYVVGLVFHFSTSLSLDASSYGFLAPTAVHVYVEGLLCVKALTKQESADQTDSWGRRWTVFFSALVFLTWCLWQPLSLFLFGSLVVLPADTLTLPASVAFMSGAKHFSPEWYLGIAWWFNAPIVALIFGQLIWGAKMDSNYAGFSLILLQIQYILLGMSAIKVFGRSDQKNEVDSNSSNPFRTPVWTMQRGLQWTVALLGLQVVAAVVLPISLGFMELDMILQPWCAHLPGMTGCS